MLTVNMHDAKTRLSELVARAVAGEPFIIAKAGKPLVKVVSLTEHDKPRSRRIGFMEGEFTVPDDFDTMFAAEIEDMFYGGR